MLCYLNILKYSSQFEINKFTIAINRYVVSLNFLVKRIFYVLSFNYSNTLLIRL